MCHLQVAGVYFEDELTAVIDIHSTAIALFVWLDAVGFSGRFSDNGFLMVRPDTRVTFRSWTEIGNTKQFEKSLRVRSLSSVYS